MFKQLKTLMLCLALITMAVPALAMGPVDVSADLALNSKYVWRGMTATDDIVLQPGFSANLLGFGVGFWGNMDLSDYNGNEWEFNEMDYILTYEMALPMISLSAGLIYYDFPNSDADGTTELYLSAASSVLLSPSLTVYQDIDNIKGAYWEASVSHGMPLFPMANLDFKGTLGLGSKGYLAGYFGVIPSIDNPLEIANFTGASMSDFTFSVRMPYHAMPFITITPAVTYSTLLGDAKDSAAGFERNEDAFFAGVTASFSF